MIAALRSRVTVVTAAGVLAVMLACAGSGPDGDTAVPIDADDIGGTVTGSQGSEAGVWVVAETSDLPTKFIRIVVTDDHGRYVIPDLPDAMYEVFVRGYGLVDSPRVSATRGQTLDLEAVMAPDPRAAAEIYPASYWLSLIDIPEGEHSSERIVREVKDCLTCHAIGDKATREFPPNLGSFDSTLDAWDRRVQSGHMGAFMNSFWRRLGDQRVMFADWTDRIAAGEFPTEPPPRPAGRERNIVITMWDWAGPASYVHDEAAADKRNPSGAPDRPIYGAVQSDDLLVWIDPVTHADGATPVPTRDPDGEWGGFGFGPLLQPSPYWGEERTWTGRAQPRNATIDDRGRVWVSVALQSRRVLPEYCRPESGNRFAQYFAPTGGGKQLARYDPAAEQWTTVDTCFPTEHLEFADDTANSLISSGSGYTTSVFGWIDTEMLDETADEAVAQGWCPAVLDTNGDGEITPGWTEPDEPVDPLRDHRITFGCYAIGVSPTDGSTWCSAASITALGVSEPGHPNNKIVRLERGANPPETCKAEIYEPPLDSGLIAEGGIDVDSNGVVWLNWRGTDALSSFDRRTCDVLNGPTSASGLHCPQGWTAYHKADPLVPGTSLSADLFYLLYVDRHNTLGVGNNTVITMAVNSDALVALLPESGEFMTLRVPYPLGAMHGRSSHGRIDDSVAGWKGRGLFSSVSTYTPWHMEGGKGSRSKLVKFQSRPDPLAK